MSLEGAGFVVVQFLAVVMPAGLVPVPRYCYVDVAITGDVYGHTSDGTARSAVDGWRGVLGL